MFHASTARGARASGRARVFQIVGTWLLATFAFMGVAFAVETQYVYDELGRLVQAARSDGTVIQYVYDANGNLLSINRHGASSLAIATFSPTITHATATVRISGSGFSAVPSENAVVVGGAPAVVSAATATQLTITVPMTAQSGLISVTTGGNTATSTQQIVVRRPSISSFSPKLVNPGATVSISGNQLNLMPGTTVFSASGVPLALNSLTNTSASLTIPANASGRIRVQTAYGEAFSVDNLYVLPASRPVTTVVASATVGVGGAAADISVNQPGKLAVLAFDATAGQRLTVQFDVFSTTPSGYTASYSIYSPTGSSMFSDTVSAARKSIHLPTITTTGRHLLVMGGTTMGTTQMSARVEEAAMLTRNSLLPVATLATGQEKQFLFNATAGETISVAGLNLVMNPSDVDSVWITVDKPDGSLLREFRLDKRFDFPGARVSLINAPVTGTYRIFIDPEGTASFTMGLRVQDMVTGTLIPDTPYPLAMTTYGEAGWLQFDATAGQRFALNMSSIAMNPTGQSLSAYVYVYDPARNEVIHNQTVSSSVTTNFQASAAGTYHALIYGQEASIFTPQVLLASGLVGDIPTDGTVVPLAATAPGQIGYFTFQGVAGQNLSFAYTELASTPATGTIALTIRKPSGGALWSATGYRSDVPGNRKSLLNLPETGTYTITADPSDHVIASYKLRLSPFITGSLTSGAAAQAVNLPVRGDAAIYTFTAAANETLALNLGSILTSPTGKQVTLTVQDAAGNEVASSTGSSGITLNLRNLAAGEYRAYVTVANAATATAQIRLVQGITGHLTSGTTTPFNTTVPGQNAYFTFDGAVNVPTSLSFVTNTLAPATGTLGFTVKRPDGTSWYTDDAYRTHLPGDQFNQLNLTQTGVYSLIVDPSDYTVMSSNVRVAPMVSGTLVPGDPNQALSFPAQGDAAIYTFTISTARNVSINLTSITTVPSGETTRIGVYNASGTSVGSNTGTSASRTLTINNLAAGTYRVIISLPEAGTATMQVRIP